MVVPAFHTLPARCDFYLVRHGESVSNSQGRIQGHTDSPLSELGRAHALAAGRWLAERGVDKVTSSPLSRARETAQAIASRAGTSEPMLLDELMELDTGVLSGRSIAELPEIDPEFYRRFRVHSWEAIPQAERIESLRRRAARVWDRVLELARKGSRRIVCVSHGGFIQWLVKSTMGGDDPRWMPIFETANCGIFHFQAESTLADPSSQPPAPGTGYYGIWKLINFVPYATTPAGAPTPGPDETQAR